MGSSDKWILAGGAIALLAGLMWWGDKVVKDASSEFAKGLKLPDLPLSGGVNLTLPSFNPTVTVAAPDLSGATSLFKTVLDQGYKNSIAGQTQNSIDELMKWLQGLSSQGTPLGGTYPVSTSGTPVIGSMPDITGIFKAANQATLDPGRTPYPSVQAPRSTSEGGNSIFVENGDNDYYIPDTSMYGKAGLPAQTKQVSSLMPELTIDTSNQVEYSKNSSALKFNDQGSIVPNTYTPTAHQVTKTIFQENQDPTRGRIGVMLPTQVTETVYW